MSSCESEFSRDIRTFDGFPGLQDQNLNNFDVGMTIGVCLRQRYPGQGWGPWRFFTGTVVRSFRLNNINNFYGVSYYEDRSCQYLSFSNFQTRLQPIPSDNPELKKVQTADRMPRANNKK